MNQLSELKQAELKLERLRQMFNLMNSIALSDFDKAKIEDKIKAQEVIVEALKNQ